MRRSRVRWLIDFKKLIAMNVDYYEVLGIRQEASEIEIELAFKGRRSQYHPDRYATTDSATIAWATVRMQEVNEAYRVLSDSDSRRSYDATRMKESGQKNRTRRNGGDEWRAQAQRNPFEEARSKSSGQPAISDYLADMGLSGDDALRFYLAPNIPEKKIATALSCRNFVRSFPPKSIYLLVDDTLFRGGADGLVVTDEWLSFKSPFLDSIDFLYNGRGGWRDGFQIKKRVVKRFEKECCTFSCFSAAGAQRLVWALNRYFSDRLHWCMGEAEKGCVDAQFFLSGSLDDVEACQYWLVCAAENGHIIAQHNLGVSLIGKDVELAYSWLLRAAQQGSTAARDRLRSSQFSRFGFSGS